MEYEEQLQQVLDFFSKTFGLPSSWFQFPYVIFNFIIPLLALTYVWYSFLAKKMRFGRGSSGVNTALAFLLAFMNTPIIRFVRPEILVPLAVGIGTLLFGSFSWKRIFLSVVLTAIVWYFYPYLIRLIILQMT